MITTKTFSLGFLLMISCLLAQAQTSTTIRDIQMVDTNGTTDQSSFLGQEVIVTGVITASFEVDNLGAIFIQQEGETEWAGIQLFSGSGIGSLKVGDKITVTGRVDENSGVTVLNNVDTIVVDGTGNITPLQLDPNLFTNYSLATTEKYESMLIELKAPSGPVSVVDVNPDAPNNFGEWLVGSDSNNTAQGCRILTGRRTSSVFSSLNVSYINDSVWVSNSGNLNVPAIVVENGDKFQAIRGIMYYGIGDMKLLPRNNDDVDGLNVGITTGLTLTNFAKVYPNPVVADFVLELELKKREAIEIDLFDSKGRLVQQLAVKKTYQAGTHQIHLPFSSIPPSGVYFLRIQADEGSQFLKLLKH